MGFIVVEKLLKKGMKIPFNKSNNKLKPDKEEELKNTMCIVCPFYENDCDFVSTTPTHPLGKGGIGGVKKSIPCGGFILLGLLIEKSIFSIDDIQNII